MAMWDYGPGPRTSLPSISHFDQDKGNAEYGKNERQKPISALSLSAIVSANPSFTHPGPPPPYSATSNLDSMPDRSGYISPPESTTRRSTREDDGPMWVPKSLPSIHEALGSRALAQSAPVSAISPTARTTTSNPIPPPAKPLFLKTHQPTSNPPTQHSPTRDVSHSIPYSLNTSHPTTPARPGVSPSDIPLARAKEFDSTTFIGKAYGYPPSPRATAVHQPYRPEIMNQSGPKPSHQPPAATSLPAHPIGVHRGENAKVDEPRQSFSRSAYAPPYGETVKRHLDIYDVDVAFHEMHEASARTLEFSSYWSQRCHQTNRSHTTKPVAPSLQEIDDMTRHSQHIAQSLNRIRDIVVLQQTSMSEEQARVPNIPGHAHYRNVIDEYKIGGFAGVDAKKRRGKAAPPGRCHSCARAETPEWRRGPDGARTLCNACGLHYAKLTRKMVANQNASSTGASVHSKGS